MPTAHATVPTDRASRYLAQLCRHLGELQHQTDSPTSPDTDPEPAHRRRRPQIRHLEWSDTHGTVDLGVGRLALQATPDALDVALEAADERTLGRLQDTVATRIQTIGRRDRLIVTWEHATTPTTGSGHALTPGHDVGARRPRRTRALLAVAALAIGLHAAVATAVLTGPSWLSWAADGVLVLVGIKLAAIALGSVVLRHRLPHRIRIPLRRRQP